MRHSNAFINNKIMDNKDNISESTQVIKPNNIAEQVTETSTDNSFLQSQLLIAMPSMGDPNFDHTVTLICQHNNDGCFGLTINRPIQITLEELFEQLNIPFDNHAIKGVYALRGGPMQQEQGFVVHDSETQWESTLPISEGLSVTASRDILFDIAAGKGPDNFLLILGCANWGADQIIHEIKSNSWLNCESDNKILFDIPYEKRWARSVNRMGIDINSISNVAGHD